MESGNITDKSMREIEHHIENLLVSEGFFKEQRRAPANQTLSPSKLETRKHENTVVQYNEMAKVMSDHELQPTSTTKRAFPANIKKNLLVSPQTVRGAKETNASNTLKEAAKQLLLNNSFV